MAIDLESYKDHHVRFHADCILVPGAVRSAIYDLTRQEIILFPTDYLEPVQYLTTHPVAQLLDELDEPGDRRFAEELVAFLNQHEVIAFVKDPERFPPLQERWDIPAIIQNAIIDVDAIVHDFDKIFSELDVLGCRYVQLRSFGGLLTVDDLRLIAAKARHKSIYSLELIVPYNGVSDDSYISLLEEEPVISGITVHTASGEQTRTVGGDEATFTPGRPIRWIRQEIDSALHCGIIAPQYLTAPSVALFMENKLFNGCLNRKIAIDVRGNIRNCPSMPETYGNIKNTSLQEAAAAAGFSNKGGITKDQISICKDCEFRYSCTDCRAYLEQPQDEFSKPLKCGYDPYSATWENWQSHPAKQNGIAFYGMEHLVPAESSGER